MRPPRGGAPAAKRKGQVRGPFTGRHALTIAGQEKRERVGEQLVATLPHPIAVVEEGDRLRERVGVQLLDLLWVEADSSLPSEAGLHGMPYVH